MVKKTYTTDVLVVGGGISGTISAIAAARNGCGVILVEKGNCLGGSATAGMLGEINGAYLHGTPIVSEIGREIIERLFSQGAGFFQGNVPMSANPDITVDRVRYNCEYLKLILDEMVEKEGIEVFFGCGLQHIVKTPSGVTLTVTNLYDEIQINGTVLIDSTGNSECIYLLGENTITTERENKQAVTTMFRLGGIDIPEFETMTMEQIQEIIRLGKSDGTLPGSILSMLRVPGTDTIAVNCTRCSNVDHESIEDVSRALLETRQQIRRITPFLREHVPGCRSAYISAIASSLGIRDRRRIDGVYEITSEDIIDCYRFEDSVAIGVYPVDIHRKNESGRAVEFIKIKGDGIYKIPYRSMLPKSLDNVIANGKCIAADDIAYGAFRVMGTLMNIAVAAGTAAAMAVKENISTKELSVSKLQSRLRQMGLREI